MFPLRFPYDKGKLLETRLYVDLPILTIRQLQASHSSTRKTMPKRICNPSLPQNHTLVILATSQHQTLYDPWTQNEWSPCWSQVHTIPLKASIHLSISEYRSSCLGITAVVWAMEFWSSFAAVVDIAVCCWWSVMPPSPSLLARVAQLSTNQQSWLSLLAPHAFCLPFIRCTEPLTQPKQRPGVSRTKCQQHPGVRACISKESFFVCQESDYNISYSFSDMC